MNRQKLERLDSRSRMETEMSEIQSIEKRITVHGIIASSSAGAKEFDLLHKDLFDSRPEVVLSALKAIAHFGHPSSARFVARLISNKDRTIRSEAIRYLGSLKLPAVVKLLSDLYKTSRDDEVRCEALRALATAAPTNPEVLATVRAQASSQLASSNLRSTAAVLFVKLAGADKLPEVLAAAPSGVVDRVLASAQEDPMLAAAVVQHGPAWYDRFTPENRKLLVDLATGREEPEAGSTILRGIDDDDPEVRSSSYRALGRSNIDAARLTAVAERLFDHTESTYSLEEEVVAAIDRLEGASEGQSISIAPTTLNRIRHSSVELFHSLSAKENRTGSDTIELGWLILHSREYMEYYASQEFRQALVHYLKGGSYHTMDKILAMLKRSAERVEVRHFDGYRALGEIIKNPKRPGMALITRDLSIAKLGKREPFGRLIRNLRIMRLASTAGSETIELATRIFTWAKEEKLFRLAEAALYCLAKFAPDQATAFCRTLLSLPIESKILSIAAIHLSAGLGGELFVNEVEKLLRDSTDSHILLNLLDAIPAMGLTNNPQVVKSALVLLRGGIDSEVVRQDARLISSSNAPNLFENITAGYERLDSWRQKLVLEAVDRIVEEKRATNREGMAEFLYKILRDRASTLRGRAAVLLWKLGDDFALKVLDRFLRTGEVDRRIEIVKGLKGHINKPLASSLLSLLDIEHAGLQEALRETLEAVTDESTKEYIRRQLTDGGTSETEADLDASEAGDLDAGIVSEKDAFRFEHEFTKELAIMFTDIQGYSAKAQNLTEMQVNSLIQDYEAILLPTVETHRGKLIKRMGDGHMFVFESALDAGLAALRMQKALKRFNSYREELMRVVVRAGIHYGQVVERGGDVFGNNVNIASRLESSAKGGSALVSQAVWERWEGRIHARELGKITVKNITEPISVYEPYEIQIDLPAELDPLQARRAAQNSHFQSVRQRGAEEEDYSTTPKTINVDPGAVRYLSGVFTRLDELCVRIERGELPPPALREELGKSWNRFQELVTVGLQTDATDSVPEEGSIAAGE